MHLGQEKTLGRLKEWFYWPGHFVMFTIGVSPASAVLLERLLPLDKVNLSPYKNEGGTVQ